MYLTKAVLFRPQFFSSASEIQVFGNKLLLYNRNLSIIFVWKEGYGFFQIVGKIDRCRASLLGNKAMCLSRKSSSLEKAAILFMYAR